MASTTSGSPPRAIDVPAPHPKPTDTAVAELRRMNVALAEANSHSIERNRLLAESLQVQRQVLRNTGPLLVWRIARGVLFGLILSVVVGLAVVVIAGAVSGTLDVWLRRWGFA